MRILSGKYKNKSFSVSDDYRKIVRPTMSVVKEALFNMISNTFDIDENISVLDVFAGLGSVSMEFASRGVVDITMIDKSYKCVAFIKKHFKDLQLSYTTMYRKDAMLVLPNLSGKQYDIIFIDPPYKENRYDMFINSITKYNLLKTQGWIIVEHNGIEFLDIDAVQEKKRKKYGNTYLSIFSFS